MASPFTDRLPRDFFDDAAPFKIDGVYCKLIPLTQCQFSLVWLEDYLWLSKNTWSAVWSKFTKTFYAQRLIRIDGRNNQLKMHRAVLGLKRGDKRHGDHEHGVTLDNRRNKLRASTVSQNACNRKVRSDNTSGFKGVALHGNVYQANIMVGGKNRFLGSRSTAEAAHRELYVPAALELHGKFTRVL